MVAAAPPPRLRTVESIATVAAKSMVAIPEAVSVVSDAAIVKVLLPESSVRPLVVVAMVAADPAVLHASKYGGDDLAPVVAVGTG